MADNVTTAIPSGTAIATDEIAGVHFPRSKMGFGPDGSYADVSSSNRLPVDIGSGPFAVTGTFYPATQPVSIASTVTVSGPLTDTQLRASPVPVSLTFPTTQAVSGTVSVSNFPTTQPVSGNVGITGSVAVTGTFWQATQPISAASLPLPAGAATAAKQDTNTAAIAKLGTAKRWFAITPDGNTDLATIPDAIYVGSAGDIVLKGSDGTNATFAVQAGQVLPFAPTRVLSTGTTATGLIGLVA